LRDAGLSARLSRRFKPSTRHHMPEAARGRAARPSSGLLASPAWRNLTSITICRLAAHAAPCSRPADCGCTSGPAASGEPDKLFAPHNRPTFSLIVASCPPRMEKSAMGRESEHAGKVNTTMRSEHGRSLPSDGSSRFRPCASLVLQLHQVAQLNVGPPVTGSDNETLALYVLKLECDPGQQGQGPRQKHG
jgi:hypothetical protein